MVYKTHGVCARAIEFELDGDKVKNVNLFRKKERKWYQKKSKKHWKEAL